MPYTPEKLPSGRWRGVVVYWIDGKRKRITATFDYEFEAEQFIRDTEARLAAVGDVAAELTGTAPTPPPPPRRPSVPTLAEFAEDWFTRRRRFLANGTVGNYRRGKDAILKSRLGRAELTTLHRADVERAFSAWDFDEVSRHEQALRMKVLRMILSDAIEAGHIHRDVSRGMKLLPPDIRPDRVLTRAEDAKLVLAAQPRAELFVLLGLDAGLRWGEAAGLTAAAIDIERNHLYVRQVVERESGLLRGYPKGKKARAVPLTDRLIGKLAPWIADREPGLLFTTGRGTQLGYDNWRRDDWYATRNAAGLADPQPRFHDLRHTYGTRLADAGVPRKEIAIVMGHADERTTARYMHAGDQGVRADLVRAALG